jgi:hypothetical protein
MAIYKIPNLNSVAGPRAGGAYTDMLNESLSNPVVKSGLSGVSSPTSITSVGSGNTTIPNVAKNAGSSSSSSSPLIDAAKIAAIFGGGALAANAIKDVINKPTTPTTPTKPTTPITPTVPVTIPKIPTTPTTPTTPVGPTLPTAPTNEEPTEIPENAIPDGEGGYIVHNPDGTTTYLDSAGKVVDTVGPNIPAPDITTPEVPTEPTGGLNQVATTPATTPNTVPVEESLAPNEQLVPKDVTPSPVIPTGGLNQTSNTPTAPAVAPPVITTPSANVSQPVTYPTVTPPAAESNPVNTQPDENPSADENGFVDYVQDELGNTYGVNADGQYFLIDSVPNAPTTSEEPANNSSNQTADENVTADENATVDENGFVGYAQDAAGNTYGMDAAGNYYLVSEAVVNDTPADTYDPNAYVDNTDPYVEPDYTNNDTVEVRKGGLVAMKNGGGLPRYAEGDSVYGQENGVDIPNPDVNTITDVGTEPSAENQTSITVPNNLPSNAVPDGEGGYIVDNGSGGVDYLDANGNVISQQSYADSGLTPDGEGGYIKKNADGTTSYLDSKGNITGSNTVSFTDKLKGAANSVTGGLSSATDYLKSNPLAGGAVAALVMQLLSKATGGGGSNYKPDMSALAIKPHTTDFGMGPARVVASGNQTPYYSPEQATQLNTNLGVAGFPTAYQQTQTQGGLASGGVVAASNHYSYGKPVDPMEVMDVRQPAVSPNPDTQAVRNGGSMHPKGPLGVPMKDGRHDYRAGAAVNGPGDGQSDDIPAMLADGEYVIDAELVSMLGNGSNKAGAQYLDKFRQAVREHKRSAPLDKIPPKTKSPLAYMKGLK